MEMKPKNLDAFRKDFENAVQELQDKYDVTIRLGKITYTDESFTAKLTVNNGRDPDDIGSAEFDENVWKYEHLGLTKGMYRRVFLGIDGKQYALLGFNTRAKKYPLIIKDIEDGSVVRAGEGFIKELRYEYYVDNLASDYTRGQN